MNEREQELFDVVKKQLQNKYHCLSEIYRMTTEMKEAFDRNDRVSAEIILKMRGKEMEQCDMCNRNLEILIGSAEENEQEELRKLLRGSEDIDLWGDKVNELKNFIMRIDHIKKKAIQIDQVISLRLAGTDSFYHAMKK